MKTGRILIAFIIIILIILVLLFYNYIVKTDTNKYYITDITITPKNNGDYYVYLPLIMTDDRSVIDFTEDTEFKTGSGDISFIETIYGKAYNISSNGIVEIKIDEPKIKKKPGAWITLENNTDNELFNDRATEFYIYFNSTEINTVHIDYYFEIESKMHSYHVDVSCQGDISNGWNLIGGSINAWVE